MTSLKIYLIILILSFIVTGINHFITEDPIDWKKSPRILEKPKNV